MADSMVDQLAHKYEKVTCRYFTGIQHECCEAGVNYKSVRDEPEKGPYHWPCLTLTGYEPARTTCEKRAYLSHEEAIAKAQADEDAVKAFLGKLADGKVCPHCDKPIESRKVIGRCEYVYPCGHRLGQVNDSHGEW